MADERKERICKNHAIPARLKFECHQHIRVDQWSPEQISGTMRHAGKKVSHTTVYNKLAGGTLYEHLRHKGHRRKTDPCKGASARSIPDRTSISERPAQVDGKRFGDWEMDLIIGRNGYQAILVLVKNQPDMP